MCPGRAEQNARPAIQHLLNISLMIGLLECSTAGRPDGSVQLDDDALTRPRSAWWKQQVYGQNIIQQNIQALDRAEQNLTAGGLTFQNISTMDRPLPLPSAELAVHRKRRWKPDPEVQAALSSRQTGNGADLAEQAPDPAGNRPGNTALPSSEQAPAELDRPAPDQAGLDTALEPGTDEQAPAEPEPDLSVYDPAPVLDRPGLLKPPPGLEHYPAYIQAVAVHCGLPAEWLTEQSRLSGTNGRVLFHYPGNATRPVLEHSRNLTRAGLGKRWQWKPTRSDLEIAGWTEVSFVRFWKSSPLQKQYDVLLVSEGETSGLVLTYLTEQAYRHQQANGGGGLSVLVLATAGSNWPALDTELLNRIYQACSVRAPVMLIPDNDPAGHKWSVQAVQALTEQNLNHQVLKLPADISDSREWWQNYRADNPDQADGLAWWKLWTALEPEVRPDHPAPEEPVVRPEVDVPVSRPSGSDFSFSGAGASYNRPPGRQQSRQSRNYDPPAPDRTKHPDVDWQAGNQQAYAYMLNTGMLKQSRTSRSMFHCPFSAGHRNNDQNASLSIHLTAFTAFCHGCHWGSRTDQGNCLQLFADLKSGKSDKQACLNAIAFLQNIQLPDQKQNRSRQ